MTESSQFKNIEKIYTLYEASTSQESNSLYIAGWVAKKVLSILKFKNCIVCKNNLLNIDISHTEQLSNTESVKENSSLSSSSTSLLKHVFIEADTIFNENISSLCFRRNVSSLLHKCLYDKLNLNFIQCIEHKEELKHTIVLLIIKLFLRIFCKSINRILSGRDTRYVGNNIIFKQAIAYYEKKRKKYASIKM